MSRTGAEWNRIRRNAVRRLAQAYPAELRRLRRQFYGVARATFGPTGELPNAPYLASRYAAEKALIANHRAEWRRLYGDEKERQDRCKAVVERCIQSPLMALVASKPAGSVPYEPLSRLVDRAVAEAGSLKDLGDCLAGRCGLSAGTWVRIIQRAREAGWLSELQAERLAVVLGARFEDLWEGVA